MLDRGNGSVGGLHNIDGGISFGFGEYNIRIEIIAKDEEQFNTGGPHKLLPLLGATNTAGMREVEHQCSGLSRDGRRHRGLERRTHNFMWRGGADFQLNAFGSVQVLRQEHMPFGKARDGPACQDGQPDSHRRPNGRSR